MKTTINRKALFNYTIIEKFEAGIVLLGYEVKSIRANSVNISNAYIAYKNGHVYIFNMQINDYKNRYNLSNTVNSVRERILLLKQREINKLINANIKKGRTIVPLSMYFNHKGLVKIECAIAEGKKNHDKREAIKKPDLERIKKLN